MAIAVCLMIFLLTILLVVHVCIPAYPYNMVGLSGGHQLKGNKPDHNRFHVDLKHPNWPNDYTFGQLMPIGQSRPQKKHEQRWFCHCVQPISSKRHYSWLGQFHAPIYTIFVEYT